MCDYSLMNFPNRLANEGEILVTQKFSTGSIGFVSLDELCNARQIAQRPSTGFWSKLKGWFTTPAVQSTVPAVCVPPGARLRVELAPERIRGMLKAEPGEDLIFTQITASWNQFRDALRIKNGQEIILQTVGSGLQIRVVSVALASEVKPHEELNYSLPRR